MARDLTDPGQRAAWWIGNLTLSDDFRGQPFTLRDWQAAFIGRLFGTLERTGRRRYKRCLLFVGRKSSKTQMSAAMGVYSLLGEGKTGQEIVVAASDREQAGVLFGKALEMIEADPYLSRQVRVYYSVKKIVAKKTGNILKVVSSEGRRQHGGNPSLLIIDELHAQRDRRLHDALTGGQATRQERLVLLITTAGNDMNSLCRDEYVYACKVRDGLIEDPTYLPIIFEAGKDDDWTDEATWHKAMPALGDFADIEFIRDEFRRAKEIASEESKFRQYYLNQWVAAQGKWLKSGQWAECGTVPVVRDDLVGRPCFGGLDLSSTSDITAKALVFPDDDGGFDVLWHFWVPRQFAVESDARGTTTYLQWARAGHITLTDKPVIDYDVILAEITGRPAVDDYDPGDLGDAGTFELRLILIDPYNARQLVQQLLEAGIKIETIPQTAKYVNDPTKYLEVLISTGKIRHGNNPVANWMADNAVAVRDGYDNLRLDKEESGGKIDGMAALVNAIAAATQPPPPTPMIYSL